MDLRKRLSAIAHLKDKSEQVSKIKTLREEHPHSITLVKEFDSSQRYNCFMHALNLADSTLVHETAKESMVVHQHSPDKFPDKNFVKYLLKNFLQEKKDAHEGGIIIYFSGETPLHAGTIDHDFVISKWGGKGNLWKHGIFEIPDEYGDSYKLYYPVDKQNAESWFKSYCETTKYHD